MLPHTTDKQRKAKPQVQLPVKKQVQELRAPSLKGVTVHWNDIIKDHERTK